jgi:benzoyl-CoA 2,3-dioxygenase component B
MQPVHEPGRIAGWVAPPKVGINDQGFEYDYVRFA